MVLEVPLDLVSDYLSRLIFAAPSSMLPILSCTELLYPAYTMLFYTPSISYLFLYLT